MKYMKLARKDFSKTGIFGALTSADGNFFCRTLEHAYPDPNNPNAYLPKLQRGTFVCVRGVHKLGHGPTFETFEVTAVPGHSGILFHPGNFNDDSAGCILLGFDQDQDIMITNSRAAFQRFLEFTAGLDSFDLTVE